MQDSNVSLIRELSMIENDDQLKQAVADAGALLQEIQDYLKLVDRPEGRVRFPRGFIQPADSHRRRIGVFIKDPLFKKNLSYNFMLSDIYRWLLYRTDLSAVAAGMIVKAGVGLAGSNCESLVRHATPTIRGRGQFNRRIAHLASQGTISPALKAELDWLWEERNKLHVVGVQHSELDHYQRDHYVRATAAVSALVAGLEAAARIDA